MKNRKRIFPALLAALALSAACAVTASAAGTGCSTDIVPELPPPIAKGVVGVDLEMSVAGRGADSFVDDGELVLYEAHVRNDTEDPWEGDVLFTVPVVGAGGILASGGPDMGHGIVTWEDVRLEPFTNVTYHIAVSNNGNVLPESFLAVLTAAGDEGFPSGTSTAEGWCGVPALYAKSVRKADRDILEVHNDAAKGGAGRVRVLFDGDLSGELTKGRGMKGVKYDAASDKTEVMLGGLSACGGAEAPGLSMDVTGLTVSGILFDACGGTDFAMRDNGDGTWSMPLVRGCGFTDLGDE